MTSSSTDGARKQRIESLAKAGVVVFLLLLLGGFASIVTGHRMAGALALLAGMLLMMILVGVAAWIEVKDKTRAIDWDPGGLLPSEYAAPPPRQVRETTQSIRSRKSIVAAVAFVAIAGAAIGALEAWPLITLRDRGVETTGVVLNRRVSRGRSTYYRVVYRFEAQRTVWIDDPKIPEEIYERSAPGTKTPVTYDASHPQTSLPVARREITSKWIAIEGVAVALGLALLLFLPYVTRLQRARVDRELQLARNGRVEIGSVTRANTSAVEYRFGDERTGQWRLGKRRLSLAPKPGDRIAVLYDPAMPDVNEPCLGLVDVEVIGYVG